MNSRNVFRSAAVGVSSVLVFVAGGTAIAGEDKQVVREAPERMVRPADVVMNLAVTRDGNILVTDREGKPVRSCRLPTDKKDRPADAKGADADKPLCPGMTDTSILQVMPVSIVRHTGSKCYTVFKYSSGTVEAVTICTPY